MNYRSVRRWMVVVVVMGMMVPSALAQTTQPDKKDPPAKAGDTGGKGGQAETEKGGGGILAGPTVTDPGASGGAANPGRDRQQRITVPPEQWFRLLQTLDLTETQQETVGAILNEYRTAARAFQQEHGEALRTATREMREARQAGQEPPNDLRRQLIQLRAKAPKPVQYQQRIWDELNADQQEQMQQELARIREEIAARRAEGRRDNGGPAMAPEGAATDRASDRDPGDGMRAHDLDEMARKRLQFLNGHRSKDARGRPGTDRPRGRETDRDPGGGGSP